MHHHKFEKSTAISSIRHDPTEKVLTVSFHSGSSHDFENVPTDVFHQMKDCESAGKFYHQNIKGKYSERK